jgi:hypothetical protein
LRLVIAIFMTCTPRNLPYITIRNPRGCGIQHTLRPRVERFDLALAPGTRTADAICMMVRRFI